MVQYHAVMIGECGEEFGVSFEADNREAAWEYLEEMYPESRVDTLSDPKQMREREERNQRYAEQCYDDPYMHDEYDY